MNYFIHRHLLLPAFETVFKRRRTFRYWAELRRSERGTREANADLQFRALRALLGHAYEHCPYYRRAWDEHGVHPRQLGGLADVGRWPVIDRDTVRAHRPEMRSTQA